MKGALIMKVLFVSVLALFLGACCVFGGMLTDGPEINLKASALWNEQTPPPGSTATVTFYVLAEGVGSWNLVQSDVPYPEIAGVLVDTFRFPYEVPLTGERVTYRYEMDLTVGGITYAAGDYPDVLTCESGEWWWYFGGRLRCSEEER